MWEPTTIWLRRTRFSTSKEYRHPEAIRPRCARTALIGFNQATKEAIVPEVKLKGPSMEERIADRLKNSGVGMGTQPDKTIQKGDSPNRLFHNAHHSGGHSTPSNNRGRDGGDGWRK
jgi:hypothetical protein